jgi:zinc protease
VFAWRAPAQGHPDWLPLQLASEVLLGGPSSRLYRRLVVESETASSVSGMLMPWRSPGLFEIFTSMVRGKTAADAEAIIDEEIERLITATRLARELAKCKNRYETGFWSELETADGKAEALGHYETVLGDYRGLFRPPARVETLTVEDVRRAAATYLRRRTRTIVIAEPSGRGDDERRRRRRAAKRERTNEARDPRRESHAVPLCSVVGWCPTARPRARRQGGPRAPRRRS